MADPKSMFNKKSITDVDVKGKRVLMRVDFNVPMVSSGSGRSRTCKSLPCSCPFDRAKRQH